MQRTTLEQAVTHSLADTMKFPQVVGLLIEAGVEAYHVDLVRHENRYYDAEGESHVLPVAHPALPSAAQDFSAANVQAAVRQSQQGQIGYKAFLARILEAGCVYYIAYLAGRRVVYLGRKGEMHVEEFPR